MAKKIGFFPDIEIPTSWDAVIIEAVQIESIEKPLASRERNSLLCIIAALCKEHKIDYEKAAKSVGLIEGMAASLGISIGNTTIENHLKKIPNALGSRMR